MHSESLFVGLKGNINISCGACSRLPITDNGTFSLKVCIVSHFGSNFFTWKAIVGVRKPEELVSSFTLLQECKWTEFQSIIPDFHKHRVVETYNIGTITARDRTFIVSDEMWRKRRLRMRLTHLGQ